jgi:hypothetical protein
MFKKGSPVSGSASIHTSTALSFTASSSRSMPPNMRMNMTKSRV